MGKIKSALELAMERTANLQEINGDTGENPESEYEPYLKASALLAGSYLENKTTLEKILETVNRYPSGVREEAARIFLKKVIADMRMDRYADTVAAYRRLLPEHEHGLTAELEKLGSEYLEQVRVLQQALESGKDREQALSHLLHQGIAGTALAGANPDRSPWWKEQLSSLASAYAPRLARIREQLLLSLGK